MCKCGFAAGVPPEAITEEAAVRNEPRPCSRTSIPRLLSSFNARATPPGGKSTPRIASSITTTEYPSRIASRAVKRMQ
jgi:hypothetical protein